MSEPIFLTLEGGEGVGKSTLARALAEAFRQAGHDVVLTREPGGSSGAETIRKLVLSPGHGESWSPVTQALLMNAARADHVAQTIRPALDEGKVVICDRFIDSTRAYQGGNELSDDQILQLEQISTGGLKPGLTLLLDGPPEAFLARRKARMLATGASADEFEARDLSFHEFVRTRFLAIAESEPERVAVIDATGTPEQVAAASIAAIRARKGWL